MTKINEGIKRYRKENHLSQEKLAQILGYKKNAISQWETGKREPNLDCILKMAFYFNVSIDNLINNKQNTEGKMINNLRNIRVKNNKTQSDIAKLTGFNQTYVSKWENGEREPDIATLIKLANYFNVSVDELVGNVSTNQEVHKFGERLRDYRKQNKLGQVELAKKLKIANGTISMWENNLRVPDIYNLIALSKIFNCSLDELVGNQTASKESTIEADLSPAKKEAMDKLLACNDRMCDRVSAYIDVLNDRELAEDISKFKHNDNF